MSKTIAKSHAYTSAALAAHSNGRDTTAVSDTAQYYLSQEVLPYLSEEEKATLQQEVLGTINNELVHPEDLEAAVPRMLRSCDTELKELRRSMNSIASAQIVETQRSLQLVQESRKQVQELRDLFLKQGSIIQGLNGGDSKSYAQLRQLHYLRDNVTSVIDWSTALKEVRYENLYFIVQQRQFIAMYQRLKRLQRIRRTVITKAGTQYRAFLTIFEPYFSKLDTVLSFFVSETYRTLNEDAMNIAIQKALEDDSEKGGADESFPEFEALRQCIIVCGEEVENPILNFGSDGVECEAVISVERISAAISANVAKLWEEQIMIDVVDPFAQISVYLEQMKKVEPLLEALEVTLIPLSTSFSFFGIVVAAMHGEVMHVMKGYLDPTAEVEANGLIEASQFAQWYKEMLMVNNYAPYVTLSTIDDMSGSFMTAAVGGLSAHLMRLCRACAMTVCSDPKGPTILPSGYPITTGPVDMFAVLQQSLGGLSTSIETTVMRQIGQAAADAVYAYLDECRQRIDFDLWEDDNAALPTPATDEEWQLRRMMLLYAFVNDCTTVENNLECIELKFASYWAFDTSDGGVVDSSTTISPFQKVQDALPENTLFFLDEITAQVERVVGGQWALLFRQGVWYEDDTNPTELILNTMAEYIEEEFSTMLPVQRLRKIISQMLVRYVEKYIATLLEFLADVLRNPKKNPVENWNTFIDCVCRDGQLSSAMWEHYAADGRGQIVALATRAFELLKLLLSVKKPVDFNFLLQDHLLEDFGDCFTFVIRFMLEARSRDIGKDNRDRMMAIWEERTAFQQRDKKTDRPTTGWSQPPSFFGSVDPTIADLERPTRLFRKSVKKKRDEDKLQKAAAAKEAKRTARKAKREQESAAGRVRGPTVRPTGNAVEVTSLEALLK